MALSEVEVTVKVRFSYSSNRIMFNGDGSKLEAVIKNIIKGGSERTSLFMDSLEIIDIGDWEEHERRDKNG